ncbi:hypothetical protein PA10_00085 [Pseudomonas phage pPa_SNUABM_DT01]|nr:hypothetical protein PA10_00085 [Pseudomonas phage pPa_SNUABM_DT01]
MSAQKPLEGTLIPLGDDLDPVKDGEYLASENRPLAVNQDVDPSAVIKTTQGIRLKILEDRFKRGIPSDDKELNLNLQLLRDLDSAALTTRKIDVEEAQGSETERLAQANNELLRMLNGRNPFAVEVGSMPAITQRADPAAALPAPKLVPDVTTQGTQPVNYDDFVAAVEASENAAAAEREED